MVLAPMFAALDTNGYVVFDGLLDVPAVEAITAQVDAALQTGEFRRQGGTVHVSFLAGPAIDAMRDTLLPAVRHMLGPDAAMASAHFRGPLPGHGGQAIHADFGGPPPEGGPQVAVAIVALAEITEEGGATRVIPGTHTWQKVAPTKDAEWRWPDERLVPLAPGAALLFNGHLWHSGTRNRSDRRRDALQVTFRR